MPHEIDIIIINYNSTDCLLKCIESIFQHKEDMKINLFVEDNHSWDHPEKIIKAYPKIHYARNDENIGFAKAVNKALPKGIAPWVILLNPDAVIQNNFFSSTISYLLEHPQIGILGPKILNRDLTVQGSARRFPNMATSFFGRTSILSKIFPNNRLTIKNIITKQSNGNDVLNVDWVSGSCMVINRSVIQTVGPLDERFFMYWEDADWCRRMRENKFEVVYFPKASIVHIGGQSSNSNFIRSRYEFHKSSYRLYFKYFSSNWFIKWLAVLGLSLRFFCLTFLNFRGYAQLVGKAGKKNS